MLNHMVLHGRLCADPELRETGSGVPVCSFRMAWSEKYKETETKLFLPCTAWRGTGEMVSSHFVKGDPIIVEGKLSTRDWEDKQGNKRQSTEMQVERVHFVGSKKDKLESIPGVQFAEPPGAQFADLPDDDGDLPF